MCRNFPAANTVWLSHEAARVWGAGRRGQGPGGWPGRGGEPGAAAGLPHPHARTDTRGWLFIVVHSLTHSSNTETVVDRRVRPRNSWPPGASWGNRVFADVLGEDEVMLGRRWALDLTTGVLLGRGGRRTDREGDRTQSRGQGRSNVSTATKAGTDGHPRSRERTVSLGTCRGRQPCPQVDARPPELRGGKTQPPEAGQRAGGCEAGSRLDPSNSMWRPAQSQCSPSWPASRPCLPALPGHPLAGGDQGSQRFPWARHRTVQVTKPREAPGAVLGTVTVSLKPNREEERA